MTPAGIAVILAVSIAGEAAHLFQTAAGTVTTVVGGGDIFLGVSPTAAGDTVLFAIAAAAAAVHLSVSAADSAAAWLVVVIIVPVAVGETAAP